MFRKPKKQWFEHDVVRHYMTVALSMKRYWRAQSFLSVSEQLYYEEALNALRRHLDKEGYRMPTKKYHNS